MPWCLCLQVRHVPAQAVEGGWGAVLALSVYMVIQHDGSMAKGWGSNKKQSAA